MHSNDVHRDAERQLRISKAVRQKFNTKMLALFLVFDFLKFAYMYGLDIRKHQ